MRTLAVTENITLDGVIEATTGWFAPAGDAADERDQLAALQAQSAASDALVVGRQTFEDLRGYWPQRTDDTTGTTEHLNRVAKYVVSSTLTDPEWSNSTVLRGPVADEVARLKGLRGADIVVTGSIRLVHDLIAHGMVDEYRLFVHPVIVGHGRRLFEGEAAPPRLRLLASRAFTNGVVLNTYAPTA